LLPSIQFFSAVEPIARRRRPTQGLAQLIEPLTFNSQLPTLNFSLKPKFQRVHADATAARLKRPRQRVTPVLDGLACPGRGPNRHCWNRQGFVRTGRLFYEACGQPDHNTEYRHQYPCGSPGGDGDGGPGFWPEAIVWPLSFEPCRTAIRAR